ncbi:MAG: polysaccharide biosynthesis tyrosine autokinase [Capsulimonadaceae bacterium]
MEEQSSVPGISPVEFIQILGRRRAIIIQSILILTAVCVAVNLLERPVYQATARLLVQAPGSGLAVSGSDNPISQLLQATQPQPADTQVEVLESPSLLRRAKVESGLAVNDDNNLRVLQIDDTNVIEVTAEAHTKARARLAANTLLNDYIQEDTDRNLSEIETALAFAEEQETQSGRDLDNSEKEIESYLSARHIPHLEDQRADEITRTGELTTQYRLVGSELAAARNELVTDQALLAKQPKSVFETAQNTNPEIGYIIDKIDDLRAQREALLQPGQYTAEAPEVQFVDAQIHVLQARLNALPTLVSADAVTPNPQVQNLINDIQTQKALVSAYEAQLTSMGNDLVAAKSHLDKYSDWAVELDRLARNHQEALDQFSLYEDKIEDLTLREKAIEPPGTIIQYGTAFRDPVRPRRLLNMVLGLLLGLLVGTGLAMLQEFLDDRIASVEDGDRILRLPSLGYVPALSTDDAKLLPLMQSFAPAAESYRVLRTNIHFASIDNPAQTLLISSANQGEGKSTTSLNVAYAMGLDGKRVIIVDTDLRRPSLHRMLSIPSVPGVTDVLLGNAPLTAALRQLEHHPMVRVLPAGSIPPNPGELVNSKAFVQLIEQLKGMADIVVFDSPPLLAAADGAIIASMMDGTILIVETGRTKKGAAARAHRILQGARAKVLGVVYNRMSGTSDGYYYYYNYKYTSANAAGAKDGAAANGVVKQLAGVDKADTASEAENR